MAMPRTPGKKHDAVSCPPEETVIFLLVSQSSLSAPALITFSLSFSSLITSDVVFCSLHEPLVALGTGQQGILGCNKIHG